MYPSVTKNAHNFKFCTEMTGCHVPAIKFDITDKQTKKESDDRFRFPFCLSKIVFTASVDMVDPIFFPGSRFRCLSFGIADDAVADAFPFVCRKADFIEDLLS